MDGRKHLGICERGACDNKLFRGYWKIWNQPKTGLPRLYCPSCGRRITENTTLTYLRGKEWPPTLEKEEDIKGKAFVESHFVHIHVGD